MIASMDPSVRLTFSIYRGDEHLRTVTLHQDVIKIGRLRSCLLRLEGEGISRLHAVIEVNSGKVEIIDLGSSSGTIVNGKRIDRRKLKPGDEVLFGDNRVVMGTAPPVEVPAPAEPAPAPGPRCPRCRQPLALRTEADVSAHLCLGCGGLWVNAAQAALTRAHGAASALRALAEDAARRAPFGGGTATFNVGCPECNGTMERMAHQRSGIVVDLCHEHGTWFDRGELQRMVERRHIDAGGPFRSAPRAADPAVPLPELKPPSSWEDGDPSTAVSVVLNELFDALLD